MTENGSKDERLRWIYAAKSGSAGTRPFVVRIAIADEKSRLCRMGGGPEKARPRYSEFGAWSSGLAHKNSSKLPWTEVTGLHVSVGEVRRSR